MSRYIIYLIGGAAVFGLAVFITWQALDAKYRQGLAEERKTCEVEKVHEYERGVKLSEQVDIEIKRLTLDDVDRLLAANDWMRSEADR